MDGIIGDITNRLELQGDSTMDCPCPNCGQILSVQPTDTQVTCPGCAAELVWSANGKKMLLAKPLSTYLDVGEDAAQVSAMWNKADQAEGLIDLHRRQATVEMSARWVKGRIALANRYLKIGGGLLAFCVVLLALAFIRILWFGHIQIDAFLLFSMASLIAPFGFFFFVWPWVERFSLAKYLIKIQEERRILQEEERNLLD